MCAEAAPGSGPGPEQWLRLELRALKAYSALPPPPAGTLRLDAMESPWSWPEALVAAWRERLASVPINRYPDPEARQLRHALRTALDIPERWQLLLGNGSDEILQWLMVAVAGPGRCVLSPEPGFAMYRILAEAAGASYCGVSLDADFQLDSAALRTALQQRRPALTLLALPHNPSGALLPLAELRGLIEAAPGLVVLDEAYMVFSGVDHLPLLDDYRNVLVLRTLSKLGLAGLRLGFLVGAPAALEQIAKLRLPYNLSALTQAAAELALQHYGEFRRRAEMLCEEREALCTSLASMSGVQVWPSSGNFLLFRVDAERVEALWEGLRERGVSIKCLHGGHPALGGCLRVTIGAPAENATFLRALGECLAMRPVRLDV